MSFGDWLKEKGLKHLGTAAKVGIGFGTGGPAGALAAAAGALGLPSGSNEEAVLAAAKADPQALVKLKEIENQIPLAQIEADKALLEAELFTERDIVQAAHTSHQVEIQSTDEYVRRTRPMGVRICFAFAAVVIGTFVVALISDIAMQNYWLSNCKTEACFESVNSRISVMSQLSQLYGNNIVLIGLLFLPITFYYGGRSLEKMGNRDDTDFKFKKDDAK